MNNNLELKLLVDRLYLLTIIISIISFSVCLYWDDVNTYFPIGCLLIITSILTIYRCRKTTLLLFLQSIMGYINISIAVLDCIYMGSFLNSYQAALRHSENGLLYAKMQLIQCTVLAIMMTPSFIRKVMVSESSNNSNINGLTEKNRILSIGSLLLVLFILLTQFSGGARGGIYVSNSNPIYEYAILIYIVGMCYADSKLLRQLFFAEGIIYVINGLVGGDRSSAFMMVVAMMMLYFKEMISIRSMLLYSFGGITLANIVSIMRSSYMQTGSLIRSLLNRSLLILFSDTVSSSFYSGVCVLEFSKNSSEPRLLYFCEWLKSLLFGVTNHTNIVRQAAYYNPNGGGGLYAAYFVFFGGIVGGILSVILLGLLIRQIFSKNTNLNLLLQIVFISLAFRWYLYTPVSLYRTICINFMIIYFAYHFVDRLLKKTAKI